MQNNAVRTVLKLSSHSSVSEHLKDLHWLPVRARIYFRYLVLIFKCLNNMAPEQLAEKLQISSAINMTLCTSKFYPSTEFGKQAFSYMAPKCWNGLPRDIRVLADINTFKSSVKTYFFDNFVDYLRQCFPYTTERISYSQPIENNELFSVYVDMDDQDDY